MLTLTTTANTICFRQIAVTKGNYSNMKFELLRRVTHDFLGEDRNLLNISLSMLCLGNISLRLSSSNEV